MVYVLFGSAHAHVHVHSHAHVIDRMLAYSYVNLDDGSSEDMTGFFLVQDLMASEFLLQVLAQASTLLSRYASPLSPLHSPYPHNTPQSDLFI
jgi:hypothetical protein